MVFEHVDEGHLGDDAGEEVGRHVGDRAHQHAAGRAALARRSCRATCSPRATRCSAAAMKSVKVLALCSRLPLSYQPIALVLAAADMGDGVDEAAIDQRQPVDREAGGDRDAVGAVAVEQAGRRAVERRVLAVEQRDRHRLAVRGRREDAPRHVERRVVAGGHFLLLAQHALARLHVVVVDARRRRHRGIGEAERVGVELVAAGQAERIGLLVEGDRCARRRRRGGARRCAAGPSARSSRTRWRA